MVSQLVSQGKPGQTDTALGQLDQGITLPALISGQSSHRVHKPTVAEIIWLEKQAQTVDAVDIVK